MGEVGTAIERVRVSWYVSVSVSVTCRPPRQRTRTSYIGSDGQTIDDATGMYNTTATYICELGPGSAVWEIDVLTIAPYTFCAADAWTFF